MHYRCLVLDHDDTVVRSAETVNYPALVEKLRRDHPDRSITFREFMLEVFDRTFSGMCQDFLHLTPEETQEQFEFWKVYVRTHIPPAYEGMDALLHDFRAQGGLVCVSSHSGLENITRDYQRDFGFTPDRIYSFELPPEQRKPSPFALEDIMRRYSLRPQELLMVDDMRTGLDMARAVGVPFACAGWSHTEPEIADSMRQSCSCYLRSVDALRALVFGD